ncbi:MAG: hypothetical protein RLZZ241_2385 [Bacteroidota bacterium]
MNVAINFQYTIMAVLNALKVRFFKCSKFPMG